VLLSACPQTWLSEIHNYSLLSLVIFIKVRDIVELALEGFACCVFAFSADFTNTRGGRYNSSNITEG